MFIILVIILIVITIARFFNWIPPFETLPVYWNMHISTIWKRENLNKYIEYQHKLLDIYSENSGYDEDILDVKHNIYKYYIDQNDSTSIEYAVAKLEYLFDLYDEEYRNECDDALDILKKNWEKERLNDEGCRLLYRTLLYKYEQKYGLLNDEISKLIVKIIESMNEIKDIDILFRNSMLINLFVGCTKDLSRWSDAAMYMDRVESDKQLLKDYSFYVHYLEIKSHYFLMLHDEQRVRDCIEELKGIAPHNQKYAIAIAELEYQLCDLIGDEDGMNKYLDDVIALSYGNDRKLYRTLQKINYHSVQENNLLYKFYCILFEYRLESYTNHCKKELNELELLQLKTFFQKISFQYNLYRSNHEIRNGNYNKAIDLFKKLQLGVKGTLIPRLRYDYMKSKVDLLSMIPSDSTIASLEPVVEELRDRVKHSMFAMSEAERTTFWKTEDELFRKIYSIQTDDSTSCMKYDIALMTKGILLSSSNNLNKDILESNDTSLIKKWNKLKLLKYQLNSNLKNETNVTQEMVDSLEHSIIKSSVAYQNSMNTWDMNWRIIQQSLPNNATAIEYFYYFNEEGKKKYGALLLNKDSECPREFMLFDEDELSCLSEKEMYDVSTMSPAYELIWKPLEKYLHKGPIYVSLDGILHNINIEVLPYDSTTLLCDKYDIRRVSSTRELSYDKKLVDIKEKTAVLYGGISFDLSPNKMKENQSDSLTYRNLSLPKGKFFHRPVQSLPASRVEVMAIDTLLKELKFETCIRESDDASEESFKSLSGRSPKIMHLATHSFSDVPWKKTNPMRECGILFSGSNFAYTGKMEQIPKGSEDGILTAMEISNLDLRNTEIVVMSSCQSALGAINADGVFGLQRGFKIAGAKTLIMSLWKVDDKKTKDFMIVFYKSLTEGNTLREAFNVARKSLMIDGCTYKDWGAFIMLD